MLITELRHPCSKLDGHTKLPLLHNCAISNKRPSWPCINTACLLTQMIIRPLRAHTHTHTHKHTHTYTHTYTHTFTYDLARFRKYVQIKANLPNSRPSQGGPPSAGLILQALEAVVRLNKGFKTDLATRSRPQIGGGSMCRFSRRWGEHVQVPQQPYPASLDMQH
jgi:hypothetical protein